MQPVISVIVPVYNGADYIERCINSLTSQTISDLQIIIVNDGSTDDTEKICEKLKKNNDEIMVVSINSSGVSAARNIGMTKAVAEYITFVDADDWLMPDMLEKLLKVIQETDSDMACCDYMSCDHYFIPQGTGSTIDITCYDRAQYIEMSLLDTDTRCWSKLYKKELLENARFPEHITIGEDLIFLTELLDRLNKVVYLRYQGYCYYQNNKGAMLEQFKPSYMDQITCWKLAKKRVTAILPEMNKKVSGKLMMAIMLVVGKLSKVEDVETIAKYLPKCKKELSEVCKTKGATDYIDKGYHLKITLFRIIPRLYLKAYDLWKR